MRDWVRPARLEVSDDVAARLVERTDGNPFFVSELVRLLVSEGALTSPDSPAWGTVPAGVRDVVRQRLEQLDAAAAEVTDRGRRGRTGASTSTSSPAPRAGGSSEVEQAVEALPGARAWCEEVGPGRYRFSHALVRDAVYEPLTADHPVPHPRVAVAAALEERAHGRVVEHAPELAAPLPAGRAGYARSAWLFAAARGADRARSGRRTTRRCGGFRAGRPAAGPRRRRSPRSSASGCCSVAPAP